MKKFEAQVGILVLDKNRQIYKPVLETPYDVVPTILKKKQGLPCSLKDLIASSETLHQVQKRSEKTACEGNRAHRGC